MPLNPISSTIPDGPFLCYNEKRDVQYYIKDKSNLGIALKKAILEQESVIKSSHRNILPTFPIEILSKVKICCLLFCLPSISKDCFLVLAITLNKFLEE